MQTPTYFFSSKTTGALLGCIRASTLIACKSNRRWLWYAVDHATNTVLAYVFGKGKDEVFKNLKTLPDPFGITRYYTDDWCISTPSGYG